MALGASNMTRAFSLIGLTAIAFTAGGCDEVAFSYSERRPVRREVVYVEPPPPRTVVVEERPVREVHVYEPRPVTEVHVHHPRPVREVHVVEPAPRGHRVVPPPPGPNYVWDGTRWKRAGPKHKAAPAQPAPANPADK